MYSLLCSWEVGWAQAFILRVFLFIARATLEILIPDFVKQTSEEKPKDSEELEVSVIALPCGTVTAAQPVLPCCAGMPSGQAAQTSGSVVGFYLMKGSLLVLVKAGEKCCFCPCDMRLEVGSCSCVTNVFGSMSAFFIDREWTFAAESAAVRLFFMLRTI